MMLLSYVLVYCIDYAATFRLRRDARHRESIGSTADMEQRTSDSTVANLVLPPTSPRRSGSPPEE